MNFFEHQEEARRQTTRLIILFALAVIGIIGALWGAILMVANFHETTIAPFSEEGLLLFLGIAVVTGLIIWIGSFFKTMQLKSGGGHVVAQSLGGRALDPSTNHPLERRVLNVVEEMAIASGIPVPTVYLLEEQGINAFAAGYRPEEAVIGVTKGCVERLSRDQLQGVIAHEFSHILNGDMALNIRLMGILFGILMISTLGRILLKSFMYAGRSYRSSSRNKGGESAAIIVLALSLLVIGAIGLFFGNWIKAAISRRREYLADASAVQFTRNTEGIGGALKAIGAHSKGAQLENSRASEASHMLFCGGSQLMATHPPLAERIARIDPNWDGEFGPPPTLQNFLIDPPTTKTPAKKTKTTIDTLFGRTGPPGIFQLAFAATLLQSVPNKLQESLRNGFGARALCYGLLLSKDKNIQTKQIEQLVKTADNAVMEELQALASTISSLKVEYRLPLVELAVPALQSLSPEQYKIFASNTALLIAADNHVALFEWALQQYLDHHIGSKFDSPRPPRFGSRLIKDLIPQCTLLLSSVIHYGVDPEFCNDAWSHATQRLKVSCEAQDWNFDWSGLESAINSLQELNPKEKQQLLKVSAECVLVDKHVPPEVTELFRALSALLGCPIPPIETVDQE